MARGFSGGSSSDSVIVPIYAAIKDRDSFSLSFWSYRTGPGGGNLGYLVNFSGSFLLANNEGGNEYDFLAQRWNGANGQWWWARPSIGVWHHIVLTYSYSATTNIPKLYYDKVLQTANLLTAPTGGLETNFEGNFGIGNAGDGTGARSWEGYKAEVAFWADKELTQGEVDTVFASGAEAVPTSLALYDALCGVASPEPNRASPSNAGVVTGTSFAVHPAGVGSPCGLLVSDTFNRTVAPGLIGNADGGSDSNKTWSANYEGPDTRVEVNGSHLLLNVNAGEWNSLVGDINYRNIEAYAEVYNFGALDLGSPFKFFRILLRKTARYGMYVFEWINDQNTTDVGVLDIIRGLPDTSQKRIGGLVVQNRDLDFKMRVQCETRAKDVALRLRYWTGATEPSTWNLERFDTDDQRLLYGAYGMHMQNQSTVHMEIDNFKVNEMAPQIMVPDSDVSVGTWTDEAGGTTNLYTHVDEPDPAYDADYIKSVVDPAGTLIKFGISNMGGTPGLGNYSINVRHKKGP